MKEKWGPPGNSGCSLTLAARQSASMLEHCLQGSNRRWQVTVQLLSIASNETAEQKSKKLLRRVAPVLRVRQRETTQGMAQVYGQWCK